VAEDFLNVQARCVFFGSVTGTDSQEKNTKYRLSIPMVVRIACTLFKLTHGASLLICSELFAVGHSTMSLMLREVVHAINIAFRSEIAWPIGDRFLQTEAELKALCGLLEVVGAIDGTHATISKSKISPPNFFYFKSTAYTFNYQAVLDSNKRLIDLFLGMSGSTNDGYYLHHSSL